MTTASSSTAAGVNLLHGLYQARSALAVGAPIAGLVLDERAYTVSGTVTVDGAPPTRDAAYCAAPVP